MTGRHGTTVVSRHASARRRPRERWRGACRPARAGPRAMHPVNTTLLPTDADSSGPRARGVAV